MRIYIDQEHTHTLERWLCECAIFIIITRKRYKDQPINKRAYKQNTALPVVCILCYLLCKCYG